MARTKSSSKTTKPFKTETTTSVGVNVPRQSASQAALARFSGLSTKDTPPPQTTQAVVKLPVVLGPNFLERIYKKNPGIVVKSVVGLMRINKTFAREITDQHARREKLMRKYSFMGSDDDSQPDDDMIDAEDPHQPKIKHSSKKSKPKPKLTEKCEISEDFIAGKQALKAAKNSLKLTLDFAREWDKKTKVKPGMEVPRLKAGDAKFWLHLESKMLSFAEYALPLMKDAESDWNRKVRDGVCTASTGLKYETLFEYRDVWWFRCLFTTFKEFEKACEVWKNHETSCRRGKDLHDDVKNAIKTFKESRGFRKRKKPTKMMDLFIQLFPGFLTSPVYALGDPA